jgi:hypothetical protein
MRFELDFLTLAAALLPPGNTTDVPPAPALRAVADAVAGWADRIGLDMGIASLQECEQSDAGVSDD